MSNLQPFLQSCARSLFALIKGMSINIQRSGEGWLWSRMPATVATSVPFHQAGGGMPEGVDIQLLRQSVLFEDPLEAVGEGRWRHGELRSLPPKQKVIGGQFPLVVGFCDVPAFFLVLPQ